MDDFGNFDAATEHHFQAWLANWTLEEERDFIAERMRNTVRDYPEMIESCTWGQIARAAGFDGLGY